MGGPQNCDVCKEAQSKYKCPSCLAPYCSIPCFKKHKETPCEKPAPPEEKPCPTSLPHKPCLVDDPSYLLEATQLESIARCTEIRDTLKNEDFQKLIYKIDSAQDSEIELEKAMELEGFRIFAEKVLSAINA